MAVHIASLLCRLVLPRSDTNRARVLIYERDRMQTASVVLSSAAFGPHMATRDAVMMMERATLIDRTLRALGAVFVLAKCCH